MSLTQVLDFTVEAELKRCLTYDCCQETGLRGAPARLLTRPGFFCHSLWEGSPPGAMFPWEDNRLELTYRLFLAGYSPTVPDTPSTLEVWVPLCLSEPSHCHSTVPTTTTWILSEAERAFGIIHPGGPQKPQRVLDPRAVCTTACVCRFLECTSETPPESQWCPRPT